MAADLTAVLSADSSQLQKALNEAKTTLNSYKNDVSKTTNITESQIKSFNKSVDSLNKLTNSTKSASSQMKGLEKEIFNLSAQYNSLSADAKKGEFGKALAKTIDEATNKYKELQKTANDVNGVLGKNKEQVNGAKDCISKLTNGIGLNIGSLTKLGGTLSIASAAYKVFQDSIASNESYVDEWGRNIETAHSIYNSFINSLNNANLSGYFTNMDNLVKAAREAYNAIDDLQTKGGVISNREAKLRAKNAEDKAIVNDKSKSEEERKAAQKRIDGRKQQLAEAKDETAQLNWNARDKRIAEKLAEHGIDVDTKQGKELIKEIKDSLYDDKKLEGLKKRVLKATTTQTIGGGNAGGGTTIKKESKVNLSDIITDDFRKELNGYTQAGWQAKESKFNDEMANNKVSQKEIKTPKVTTPKSTTTTTEKEQPLTDVEKAINNYENKVNNLNALLKDSEISSEDAVAEKLKFQEQLLKTLREHWGELTDEQKAYFSGVKGDYTANQPVETPKVEAPSFESGSMKDYEDRIKSLKDKLSSLTIGTKEYNDALKELKDTQEEFNNLTDSTDYGKEAFDGLIECANEFGEIFSDLSDSIETLADDNASGLDKMAASFQLISDTANSLIGVIQTIQAVTQAFAAAKVAASKKVTASNNEETASNVGTAISSSAAAMGNAAKSGASMPFPLNIAAIAAGVAAVAGVIATIFSIVGSFADGGIIQGNKVGDFNLARVNGGEMILNGTQQSKLFQMLNSDGFGGKGNNNFGNIEFKIKGDTLIGVQENYYKKQSRL